MAVIPKHLLWIDLETTALPEGNDYSKVFILEVGVILTDLNLNKLAGYQEVVKMTDEMSAALKDNPGVLELHRGTGLIKDSIESKYSVRDVQQEILELMDEFGAIPGEVAIAGSGVTAFDMPVLKEHMPGLASGLMFYSYDVGVFRRVFKALAPRDIVNPTGFKYGANKVHRAFADIEDHLNEAKAYQEALFTLIPPF